MNAGPNLKPGRVNLVPTLPHTCHPWLQDHPPPSLPTVRSGINHFCTPNSIYSTFFLSRAQKSARTTGVYSTATHTTEGEKEVTAQLQVTVH